MSQVHKSGPQVGSMSQVHESGPGVGSTSGAECSEYLKKFVNIPHEYYSYLYLLSNNLGALYIFVFVSKLDL